MMRVEKRLKAILDIKNRDQGDEKLREFAHSFAVSLDGTYHDLVPGVITNRTEVLRRIREAARSQREEKSWVVPVVAAVASALSALAAWCAVLKK